MNIKNKNLKRETWLTFFSQKKADHNAKKNLNRETGGLDHRYGDDMVDVGKTLGSRQYHRVRDWRQ